MVCPRRRMGMAMEGEVLSNERLPVVRRPTGGGAILHDREVTYCLIIDDTLPIEHDLPDPRREMPGAESDDAWCDALRRYFTGTPEAFARLDDERLLRGALYVLTARTSHPEAQAAEVIPKLSKIASWEDIGTIVHAATSGVPLQVTYRPPAEIPARAGLLYFILDQSGPYWRNVAAERAIAIYLPPPYDPSTVQLELLAIPGGTQA